MDAKIINSGIPIDREEHIERFIYRLTFAVVLSMFSYQEDFLLVVIFTLWCGALFWLIFDLLLNLFRGLPWNYVGNTSFIDRLYNKHPTIMIVTKLVLYISLTIIYLWYK
jgi:hypothetical protein